MKKNILILAILSLTPFIANAWTNCGKINGQDSNCEYQVSSDGVLTIRPVDSNQDAIMPTYSHSSEVTVNSSYRTTAPWYDERHDITSLQIEDGIQNISKDAFMEMRWLKSVDMADSVISIGSDAFTNAISLTDVNLSKNLKTISSGAFQRAVSLKEVSLPEGLNLVHSGLFNYTNNITSLSIPDSLIDSKDFNIAALERSNIQTLYCSKEKETACDNYIKRAKEAGYAPQNLSYQLYEKYGSGYVYGGKFYANSGDVGTTKYIQKRIYTIDEANKVTGPVNRVSIRYR